MEALAPYVCPTLFPPRLLWDVLEPTHTNVCASEAVSPPGEPDCAQIFADRITALNPDRAFAKKSRQRTASTQSGKQKRSREHNRTVLVVDDVADVTEMIALFLRHAGYEVMTANSADKALQLTAESSFDIVISDIGMPDMNGYELAESLRSRSDYRTTPLIAVTGYTEYDDRGRSLRAGFDAHLTKPINPSQLLDLIRELLS